ncbi:DegV family protein [Teredinibacter turnerae]|uniref:DegV family protein n=1 Tax=Teredinibacter turnerae (strain ATCC 39867 / T7901) TaxID=377629 RepID=C5BS92_TERTT|nr:DegV family protein [Teredinibacter turnerae]ACR11974.1 conserved hypothetical protein [Teredinibacter turnerae T7901]
MPKTAIILDSACSLPNEVCARYGISFVPLTYTVNRVEYTDPCDQSQALLAFATGQFDRKNTVFTSAPSSDAFEKAIQRKLNAGYDTIIVQTVNRTQGETYLNANTAVTRIQKQLGDRKAVIRVMDSRTVFAGQGLLAVETVRRLLKGDNEDDVRRKMNKLSSLIHTFIVPRSPLTALERSRERNEKNVGWTQALVASTLGIHPVICNTNDSSAAVGRVWGFEKAVSAVFAHACDRIEAGLYSPIITLTYAGAVEELRTLPGYASLSQLAKQKKVKLIPAVASMAAGIYTSVGSLSLAVATAPHNWSR